MDRVVLELRRWLERNGLPTDGVELKLIMPTSHDAGHARSATKAEMQPHLIVPNFITKIRGDVQLYGVDVSFERQKN